MKNTLKTSILSLAVTALGLGACGPEIPANPTWQADIRPLMVARCIRCHDGAGHIDPATSQKTKDYSVALSNMNFNVVRVEDLSDSARAFLKGAGPMIVRAPIGEIPIMPPPPAEKLEDWQIQLLDNWWKKPELR